MSYLPIGGTKVPAGTESTEVMSARNVVMIGVYEYKLKSCPTLYGQQILSDCCLVRGKSGPPKSIF